MYDKKDSYKKTSSYCIILLLFLFTSCNNVKRISGYMLVYNNIYQFKLYDIEHKAYVEKTDYNYNEVLFFTDTNMIFDLNYDKERMFYLAYFPDSLYKSRIKHNFKEVFCYNEKSGNNVRANYRPVKVELKRSKNKFDNYELKNAFLIFGKDTLYNTSVSSYYYIKKIKFK